MRAVVFVGPSLDRASAACELDAEFMPPIKRGDIRELLARETRPLAIGIVDGKFLQSLSVSPKEVLRAIDEGVKVFGSSSMGALRAVECAPYGMVGVGKIFEEYLSGRVEDDDEVAIVYDDGDGGAISEPLINMRFAVAAGISAEAFSCETGDRFLRIAKEFYFPYRTIPRVLASLRPEVNEEEHDKICRFFASTPPDTKRDDALMLLAEMRKYLEEAESTG